MHTEERGDKTTPAVLKNFNVFYTWQPKKLDWHITRRDLFICYS